MFFFPSCYVKETILGTTSIQRDLQILKGSGNLQNESSVLTCSFLAPQSTSSTGITQVFSVFNLVLAIFMKTHYVNLKIEKCHMAE